MDDDTEQLTDALLEASRALVAVAARSLSGLADGLTLPEFRSLIVLHRAGPLPVTVIAERVGVHQSTATRMTARLQRRDLVATGKNEQDRRLTLVTLTGAGAGLVDEVLARRRADIAAVVARMPAGAALQAHAALQAFAEHLHEGAPHGVSPPPGAGAATSTWAL